MALLREFERSGLSMAEFCRRREVGYSAMAALIAPEFHALIHDAGFRRRARIILVETYLPPTECLALYALLGGRAK